MSVVHGRKHSVRVERESIDVTLMSKPDPKWRHVDTAGHVHVWVKLGDEWKLPTLESREVGYYEDGEPQCASCCIDCGERVETGLLPNHDRQFMAGKPSYFIDDEPVSQTEAVYTLVADELLPPLARERARQVRR